MPTVPGDQAAGRQPGAEPYMRARVGADDLRPGSSPLPTPAPCRPFAVRAFAAAAIGVAAGLVGGGCTPSVQMQAVMPAKNEDAARLRRVAVLNFEGRAGQEVADRLEEVLVGLRLNDEPYYTVVDRRRTKELVAEAARGVRGEVREGTAAKLGRQIGAEGVFLGRVNDYSVDRSSYTAKQSHCARYSSSGNKCRNTTWVEVPCTRTTATVRVAPRLVDVESGRVVYSAEKSGTASTSYCRGEGPDTADEQLAVQARDAAVEQILADIAPHPVTVSMPIKTTLAQADQRYAEQFAGAAKFAQSGRMDRACEIWQGLAAGGAEDLALAYNLGTCAEVRGETDEASAFYAKADKMTTKPDSDINRALERIRHAAAALRQTM